MHYCLIHWSLGKLPVASWSMCSKKQFLTFVRQLLFSAARTSFSIPWKAGTADKFLLHILVCQNVLEVCHVSPCCGILIDNDLYLVVALVSMKSQMLSNYEKALQRIQFLPKCTTYWVMLQLFTCTQVWWWYTLLNFYGWLESDI